MCLYKPSYPLSPPFSARDCLISILLFVVFMLAHIIQFSDNTLAAYIVSNFFLVFLQLKYTGF